MQKTWKLLNVFIMVCSVYFIIVEIIGFMGKPLRLETRIWRRDLVFLRQCHRYDGTAVVCGQDKKFITDYRSEHSHTGMSENAIGFFSERLHIISFGNRRREWSLLFSSGFIAVFQRLCAFFVLWLWRCMGVQRFFLQLANCCFSLALWFLKAYTLKNSFNYIACGFWLFNKIYLSCISSSSVKVYMTVFFFFFFRLNLHNVLISVAKKIFR